MRAMPRSRRSISPRRRRSAIRSDHSASWISPASTSHSRSARRSTRRRDARRTARHAASRSATARATTAARPAAVFTATSERASAVALEVAGTRDPQLVGDRRQKMRERAVGNVARADAQRELAVEVARPSMELLDVVRERVRVAQEPRERTDLAPHQRRSERDLALEDAETVRGDERSESKPRIVDPREQLCLDELAHGL